jgi:hypothetical protein
MTVQQLMQMQRTQPFRAYRIHLADGRSLEVNHPDFVARSPSGRTVIIYKIDETFEVVDLLLVTSLEVMNGKETSS